MRCSAFGVRIELELELELESAAAVSRAAPEGVVLQRRCFLERRQHVAAWGALQRGAGRVEIPEPHPRPFIRGMPFRHPEDRIEADTAERYAAVPKRADLLREFPHPWPALIAGL